MRDETIFRDSEATAESPVRQTLADIGYAAARTGIDPRRCRVQIAFNNQARDAGQGAEQEDGELGAGDQGPDVRLCLGRDAGSDAAVDRSRPRTDAPIGRAAPLRRLPMAARELLTQTTIGGGR